MELTQNGEEKKLAAEEVSAEILKMMKKIAVVKIKDINIKFMNTYSEISKRRSD